MLQFTIIIQALLQDDWIAFKTFRAVLLLYIAPSCCHKSLMAYKIICASGKRNEGWKYCAPLAKIDCRVRCSIMLTMQCNAQSFFFKLYQGAEEKAIQASLDSLDEKLKKRYNWVWRNQICNFFLDILICHKDIGVFIISDFFYSAHLFTVTGLLFLDSA